VSAGLKTGNTLTHPIKQTGIDINGLNKEAGIAQITRWLESEKLAHQKSINKIRDWLSADRDTGANHSGNSLGGWRCYRNERL